VECFDGEKASRFYCRVDGSRTYLAVFNFSAEPAVLKLHVDRIGQLPANAEFLTGDGAVRLSGPVLEIPLEGHGCILLHHDQ